MKPQLFTKETALNAFGDTRTLVLAAGFEERILALPVRLLEAGLCFDRILVLDYPDKALNEPRRSRLLESLTPIGRVVEIVPLPEIGNSLALKDLELRGPVAVDITGMDRIVAFGVLAFLTDESLPFSILYTEAENYYPLFPFYEKLISGNASVDESFARYLSEERTAFAYSYDCEVVQPACYSGDPEPGRPFLLVSFFPFKRSRLHLLLQTLEVERKMFILGEPVREDLKWRHAFMRIANWDMIRRNKGSVVALPTLYPDQTRDFLESAIYVKGLHLNYNVVLAPLGSKMQTVGAFLFWRNHPEVTIVFTHPKRFFKEAYSDGYRETFVIPASDLCQSNPRR